MIKVFFSNSHIRSKTTTYEEPTVRLNELQSSTSNRSTRTQSTLPSYEVPCERQYEYVDKSSLAPPKTFTYDYATFDGLPLHKNEAGSERDRIGQKKVETHDDYVIPDKSYVTVLEAKYKAKEEDTHDDYVVRDESYVTVIDPTPESKEDTHDDYVVRDESYVTVINH